MVPITAWAAANSASHAPTTAVCADSGRSEGLSYGVGLSSPYGENILSLAYEYADLSFNTSSNDMDEKISGISLSIARSF